MKNNEYVYVSFGLHKERDHRLINWLAEQSNKTDIIRKALNEAMQQNEPSDILEILEIVRDLQSKQFTIVSNGNDPQLIKQVEETEPQDMADTLDNLGA